MSQDQNEHEENVAGFSDLPEKILEIIFGFLKTDEIPHQTQKSEGSLKNCMLVSRQWNRVISSSIFLMSSFNLDLMTLGVQTPEETGLMGFSRRYQSMNVDWNDDFFEKYREVIIKHAPLVKHLVVGVSPYCNISRECSISNVQAAKYVKWFTHVESLSLICFHRSYKISNFAGLKSKKLDLFSKTEDKKLITYLKTQLGLLEDFTLSSCIETEVLKFVFNEMTKLKKLSFKVIGDQLPSASFLSELKVTSDVQELTIVGENNHFSNAHQLLAMLKYFSALESLLFRGVLLSPRLEKSIIQQIHLPHLKHLQVSSTRNALLVHLKMDQLESLDIGLVMNNNDWMKNVKNIKKLSIMRFKHCFGQTGSQMDLSMTDLLKAFPELRHLKIGLGMCVGETEMKSMKENSKNLKVISSLKDFWIFSKPREEALRVIGIKDLYLRAEDYDQMFGDCYQPRYFTPDDYEPINDALTALMMQFQALIGHQQ